MPDETINIGSKRHTVDDGESLRRIVGRRIKARTGKVWNGTKAVASEPATWVITGSVGLSWLMMERAAQLDRVTRERVANMGYLKDLEAKFEKLTDGPSPTWMFAVRHPEHPDQEATWLFDPSYDSVEQGSGAVRQ